MEQPRLSLPGPAPLAAPDPAPPPTEQRDAAACPGTPLVPPGMVLRESPFPSRPLAALDGLAQGLLCPGFWALNRLLDLQPTTAERARGRGCCGCTGRALAGLACAALLLLSLPLTALGLLLWLPTQAARRPFAYHHAVAAAAPPPWDPRQRRSFTFVSANLCLLPSGLAKFSNLGQTLQRAAYVAQQLAPEPPGAHASLIPPGHGEAGGYGGTLRSPPRPRGEGGPWHYGSVVLEVEGDAAGTAKLLPADASRHFPADLSERFPADADFLCLQEVFDVGAAARLRQQLAGSFPHIVYDVGARGLRGCGLKLFGSGLFLASRYPLLAVQYHCYPNGAREDALSAKGLLSVQVLLGCARGQRVVGYLSCTHLQAPAPDAAIRSEQLTLGLHWVQLFQDAHEQRGDIVAFDVFCGDLNFDNCSRGDEPNQSHEIFKLYRDPCRVGPKQDEPWAMGTLLDYLKIYEEPVSTPENMKR
ncbi:sphingomyelin phosphodiesterase 5-like [Oxyura jamaicensis]|uniref:sphingomyelin phosphodiesterase 5-like n=1 Tax=Oxyura jamaicensis TaxID=8884 RepID=UPI0015A61A18|nr:sphingomyelin phosphodiesterase 5-like [Oxyura jamaicensis]